MGKRATCEKNIPIKMHASLLFRLPSNLTAPGCTEGCRPWSKPQPPFPTTPALLPVSVCLCFQFMPLSAAAHVPWRCIQPRTPYQWLCHQPRILAVLRPCCQGCVDGIIKAFCPFGQPGNSTVCASAVELEVLPDPRHGERPDWLAALVDDYAV